MIKQATEFSEKRLSPAKLAQVKIASQLGADAGKQNAIQRRKEYNANPNHCLNCRAPILVSLENMKPSLFQQVKEKRFCNRSCAAQYNMMWITTPRHKPTVKVCSQCGGGYTKYRTKLDRCPECVQAYLNRLQLKMKSECHIETIRSHARATLFKTRPRVCQVCGYSFHTDACHIKPIKKFPPTTLVEEINALSNLAALCPNHHLELDRGALKLVGMENVEISAPAPPVRCSSSELHPE